jgi:pimeloyl-ACP methyl ester carboxylesterase
LPDPELPPGFRPLRLAAGERTVAGAEAGEGPPLVLLHGLGGTWEYWAPAMTLLARHARCIALDLPGFGHSDDLPGEFTLDAAVARLAAALASLGMPAATVCGHSLGGPLAVRLARNHPGSTSQVVLVGPSGLAPAPFWQRRLLTLVPVYQLLRRAPVPWEHWLLRVGPLRRGALRALVHDPATVSGAMARTLVDGGREARELKGAIDASFATGLDAEARLLDVPVDAIWGERDRMVPVADAAALLRAVPSARLRLMTGCGHLPMVEDPAAFAALLAELSGLRARVGEA